MSDVEKTTQKLAEIDVDFAPDNPVTQLMIDESSGKLRDDILQERVLSAIVEFSVATELIPEVISELRLLEEELNTVFSVDLITKAGERGELANVELLKRLDVEIAPNCKVNIGLGRPTGEGPDR